MRRALTVLVFFLFAMLAMGAPAALGPAQAVLADAQEISPAIYAQTDAPEISAAIDALTDAPDVSPAAIGQADQPERPQPVRICAVQPGGIGAMLGQARALLYEPLCEISCIPEHNVIERLAASFSWEGADLTVMLRGDIAWPDGGPVTASDVIASYYRAYELGHPVWRYLTAIDAIDSRTLVFRFAQRGEGLDAFAFDVLIDTPADPALEARIGREISERIWDELLGQYPLPAPASPDNPAIGGAFSGPYVLASVGEDTALLTPNPAHPEGDMLPDVELHAYAAREDLIAAISTGAADINMTPLTPGEMMRLGGEQPATLWTPSLAQRALLPDTDVYPLGILKVRQAIAFAIDYESLILSAPLGTRAGDPYMSGLAPTWSARYADEDLLTGMEAYTYEPEYARELLLEQGWQLDPQGALLDENGEPIALTIGVSEDDAALKRYADMIAIMLRQVGFDVSVSESEARPSLTMTTLSGSHTQGAWAAYSQLPISEEAVDILNRVNRIACGASGSIASVMVGALMTQQNKALTLITLDETHEPVQLLGGLTCAEEGKLPEARYPGYTQLKYLLLGEAQP